MAQSVAAAGKPECGEGFPANSRCAGVSRPLALGSLSEGEREWQASHFPLLSRRRAVGRSYLSMANGFWVSESQALAPLDSSSEELDPFEGPGEQRTDAEPPWRLHHFFGGNAGVLPREFSTERDPPLLGPCIGLSRPLLLNERRLKEGRKAWGQHAFPLLPGAGAIDKESAKRRNVPSAQHCGNCLVTGCSLGVSNKAMERSPCAQARPSPHRAGRGRPGLPWILSRLSAAQPSEGVLLEGPPRFFARDAEEDGARGAAQRDLPLSWFEAHGRTTLPQPVSTARCFWSTG